MQAAQPGHWHSFVQVEGALKAAETSKQFKDTRKGLLREMKTQRTEVK